MSYKICTGIKTQGQALTFHSSGICLVFHVTQNKHLCGHSVHCGNFYNWFSRWNSLKIEPHWLHNPVTLELIKCLPWLLELQCLTWWDQIWRTQMAVTSQTTRFYIVSELLVCTSAVAWLSVQTLKKSWKSNAKYKSQQKSGKIKQFWIWVIIWSY